MDSFFSIGQIKQKDNHHFSIEWTDGMIQDFRLSDLQKQCPCANCIDEMTNQPLLNPQSIDQHVRALTIRNVGRYALRIQFTSGCSKGIYSFNQLRQLKRD